MHMIVKILVFAEDEEDAVSEAHYVLDRLCGEGEPFDYFSTFNDKHALERWGEMPPAVKVCADLGSDKCDKCSERFKCYTIQTNSMIEEAMQKTKQEFLENLAPMKKLLATHNDDQLFEDHSFMFRCYQIGQYKGPCVSLYDQDGEGIRDNEHLNHVLSRWACNHEGKPDPELRDKSIFCVPADVHY